VGVDEHEITFGEALAAIPVGTGEKLFSTIAMLWRTPTDNPNNPFRYPRTAQPERSKGGSK